MMCDAPASCSCLNPLSKMEERFICAVCHLSELFYSACVLYRDRNKKEQAWVKVSEETGFEGKFCKYSFPAGFACTGHH